jgi:PucR family transcriptional regulator, purine catabolism regulatory protein
VFALTGTPDAGTLVLAERTATTLTLASLARGGRRAASPQRAAYQSVLAALAGRGFADPAALEARVVGLGLPVSGRGLVPVVLAAGGASPAGAAAGALSSACHDMRVPAIAGTLDDHTAAALLALPPGADQDVALTGLADRLRQAGALGPTRFIGVAEAVTSVGDLPNAFGNAARAAGAAARLSPGTAASPRPFVYLAELGLAGLAWQFRDDPRFLAFAEHELGPLLRHDDRHGTDLVAVLASFLDSGGNKAAAAKRCGIARPTLYERLSQIQQVLGASLDDARRRTTLHAALLIRQLGSGQAG